MNKEFLFSAAKTALSFVLVLGIFTACSNSTSTEEEEEHEPTGFVIFEGDSQIINQNLSSGTTPEISVEASASRSLRIAFLEDDGEVFTPDKTEHSLRFEITDGTGSISIVQPNEQEPFFFTLTGDTEGQASFSFEMLHVGSVEFGPANISVTVTSSN